MVLVTKKYSRIKKLVGFSKKRSLFKIPLADTPTMEPLVGSYSYSRDFLAMVSGSINAS
jgi:hypothetical protein